MSFELIAALVGGVLALIGGGFGWSQIRKHGRTIERHDQAERERDAAIQEAEEGALPPLTGRESVDALRRLSDD